MFKKAKGFDTIIGPGVNLNGAMSLAPHSTTVLECSGSMESIHRRDNFDETVNVEIRSIMTVDRIDVSTLTVASLLTVRELTCDTLIVLKGGCITAESVTADNMEIQRGGRVYGKIQQGGSNDTVSD